MSGIDSSTMQNDIFTEEIAEKAGYLNTPFEFFCLKEAKVAHKFEYHYHEFYKIYWLLDGKVEYHVEGKTYSLLSNDIILISKGQIHKLEVDDTKPYERIIFYISEELVEELEKKTGNIDYKHDNCFTTSIEEESNLIRISVDQIDELNQIVKRMKALKTNTEENKYFKKILMEEILLSLNIYSREKPEIFHNNAQYDTKIVEVMQYINENLNKELSVEAISEKFYLSKYYLMHKFKEDTGYSVHQYILEKRILLAKTLLSKGIPATNVAYECGFKDYSTFNRAFKKKMIILHPRAKGYNTIV